MPDIRANAPDGTIHNFPDGTPDAVVDRVMHEYITSKSQAQVVPAAPRQAPATGAPQPSQTTMRAADPMTWTQKAVSALTPPALEEAVQSAAPNVAALLWGPGGVQRTPRYSQEHPEAMQGPAGVHAAVGPDTTMIHGEEMLTPGTRAYGAVKAVSGLTDVGNLKYMALPGGPLGRAAGLGFGAYMTHATSEIATQWRQLKDQRDLITAAKNPGWEDNVAAIDSQLRELEGGGGASAVMAAVAARHGVKGETAAVPYSAEDFAARAITPGTPLNRIQAGPLKSYYTEEQQAPVSTSPQTLPTPRPAGLATGGTIGMDRLDPKDLVAPAAKATTVDRQKMADARADTPTTVTATSMDIAGAIADLTENRHPDMVGMGIKLPGGSTLGEMAKFLSVEKNADGNYRIADTPQNQMMKQQLIGLLRQLQTPEDANIAAASTLPESQYRPSEKAETMSAPTKDLGPDFKINEWKHEIERNQGVVDNPAATVEERQIASDRLRDAKEGIASVSPIEPTPGMVQSLLTGQMEPLMTEKRLLEQELERRNRLEAAKPVDLAPKPEEVPATAPPPRGSAVDYNLPKPLVDNIELSLKLKKLASREDNTEEQTAAINSRIVDVNAEARQQTRSHFNSLSNRQLDQLQTDLNGNADLQEKDSKGIKDRVAENERIKAANAPLKAAQATGGPPQVGIDPETGAPKVMKPESAFGIAARDLIRRIQGKQPLVDPSQLIVHPKPEGMSEADYKTWIDEKQAHRVEMETQITDAYEIVRDTRKDQGDLFAMLHDYDEHVGLIGEYPKDLPHVGERKGLGGRAKILPEAAPGKEIGIEEARRLMGKAVNRIPSNEEFLAHADGLAERARVNRMLSDVIDKEKDRRAGKYVPKPTLKGPVRPLDDPSQRGFIGPDIRTRPERLKIADEDTLLSRAKTQGLDVREVDNSNPSPSRAWLSKDGTKAIRVSDDVEHDTTARMLLERDHPDLKTGDFGQAMLLNGWTRKLSDHIYQVHRLTSDNIPNIAEDGRPGRELTLEQFDAHGHYQAVDISSGWENTGDLGKQIYRELRNQRGYELGASGVATATGMGVGGVVGMAAGHALGVDPVISGSIGMLTGVVAPHIMERLRPELSKIAPLLKNFNVTVKDWMQGPDQKAPLTPGMSDILERQRTALGGQSGKTIARIMQFPPEVVKRIFDRFATINDQPSAIQRYVMQLDPIAKVFNKAKIAENDSAYIAARLASGGNNGQIATMLAPYKSVIGEAQKLGLTNQLAEYLNLTNYRRVYQTLREHSDNLNAREQDFRSKLQDPNLTTNQRVALENNLSDIRDARTELNERIKSGQVVPQYNEKQVNTSLAFLQKNLDPKVHELATKVWQANRDVLDLAHEGKDHIVADADYKTFVDRGLEYVPMTRIMEATTEHPGNLSAPNARISPLYLRNQNIIRSLEGSARTNVDPLVASANAMRHTLRQIQQNKVFNKLVDEAEQDPNGVGNLFKQVPQGYKPGPDETTIGGYRGDGEQVTYAVPRALGETLKVASPIATSTALSTISRFASKQFRTGVTIGNVAFAVFSIPRHAMDQLATSKVGANILNVPELAGWIRDYTKALGSSVVKGEWYREALHNGALDGSLQNAISPERELIPGKTPRRTLIGGIEEFNKRWDGITKVMTYQRMIADGHSPTEATWEARRYGGAPDYSHMGTDMPALNLAFMFTNAKLQYSGRLLAALSEKERQAHIAGAVTAITVGTLALWEHNHAQRDKDGNPLWNKVPYADRERYWCVLVGNQTPTHTGSLVPSYIRIPKPPIAQLFGNPMEDMLFKLSKTDERSYKQIGLNNLQNWLPGEFDLKEGHVARDLAMGTLNTANPALRVPLGLYSNTDPAFGGRPIVGKGEQGIETELQYSPRTPEIYKRMGEGGVPGAIAGGTAGATMGAMWGGRTGALVGGITGGVIGAAKVSPRQLEYAVQGLTGGVGQMTAQLTNIPLGAQSKFPFKGPEAVKQIPVAGQVAGRFMGSGMDQHMMNESDKFYDNLNQFSTIANSLTNLQKTQPDQVLAYRAEHKNDLHLAALATATAKDISEINARVMHVQQHMEATGDPEGTGYKLLELMNERKLTLMKRFNECADAHTKTSVASPSRQEGWSR